MKSTQIALLTIALAATAACSDEQDKPQSDNSPANDSSQVETAAVEKTSETVVEEDIPQIDIFGFDIQGIKLGMSESEASKKMDEVCQKNGRPAWKKIERKDSLEVIYQTLLSCDIDKDEKKYFNLTLSDGKVSEIDWSRIVMEDERPEQEALVAIADKAKQKFGEPSLELIEGYEGNGFFIDNFFGEREKYGKQHIILCWYGCLVEKTGSPRYDTEVSMSDASTGLVTTITPDGGFGRSKKGAVIHQILADGNAKLQVFQAYLDQYESAKQVKDAAEKAASQDAAKKVEF